LKQVLLNTFFCVPFPNVYPVPLCRKISEILTNLVFYFFCTNNFSIYYRSTGAMFSTPSYVLDLALGSIAEEQLRSNAANIVVQQNY